MRKAAVIGGGAAGMMTAVLAAGEKTEIHLYEKNEKLGKKLFITGKGRCNVTNDCPTEEFFTNVVTNPKFLYSSAYSFDSAQVQEFFEAAGVRLKVERGNRVFPESDHSSDIIRALETELKRKNVQVHKNTKVKELLFEGDRVKGIRLENGKELFYNDVVVATGGMSYQTTGSDGDGYRFAEEAGLAVTPLRPALVPLETEEAYIRELQGLSLKNVTMTIKNGKKTLFDGFGEMLFTHFGISGPLGLSASSYIGKALEQQPLKGYLNLKPALTEEQLDARILREFEENRNKQFRNVINSLFPAKLLPVMLSLGGIDPYKQVNAVSKAERQHFEELITHFPFTVTGTRGFREAIITQGGVSVKEIRPGTMEAKKKEGLYFVGEVLDLDALTGGFNLQIAWASAHAAAEEGKGRTGIKYGSQILEFSGGREKMRFNLAIDGPAGAGKSTIAKRVAKELSFVYVDTGAMYRAMGIYFSDLGIAPEEQEKIEAACKDVKISISYENGEQQVYLNGVNVTGRLRTEEAGKMASATSAYLEVRKKLVELQQEMAENTDLVMDGRDIGTAVLPNAPLKVYLTASAHVRALSRWKELTEKGQTADLAKIEEDINERDYQDMHREHSPLVQAEDAVLVDSSEMTIDEVVEKILSLARERM